MAQRTRWEAVGIAVTLAGIALAVILPDIGPTARFAIFAACLIAGVLVIVFAPKREVPPQAVVPKPSAPIQATQGRPRLIEAENVENRSEERRVGKECR